MLPDGFTPEELNVPIAVPGKVAISVDKYAVNTLPPANVPTEVNATDPAPDVVQLPKLNGEPVTTPAVMLHPLSVMVNAAVGVLVAEGALDTICIK